MHFSKIIMLMTIVVGFAKVAKSESNTGQPQQRTLLALAPSEYCGPFAPIKIQFSDQETERNRYGWGVSCTLTAFIDETASTPRMMIPLMEVKKSTLSGLFAGDCRRNATDFIDRQHWICTSGGWLVIDTNRRPSERVYRSRTRPAEAKSLVEFYKSSHRR